jgi:hypothetical protein
LKSTKILVLSLLLVCGFVASTNAQFYVKVGGGYSFLPVSGFPVNDREVPPGYGFYTGSDSTGSVTYESFGKGVQPVLGFGYFVTKNIALELNGMYLIGQKIETNPTNYAIKGWGEGIFISPAVRLVAPLKGFSPYCRMGLVIGIPKGLAEYNSTTPAVTEKWELKGGIALGMNAALGIDIKASKQISVFIELDGMALNWAPDERENTERTPGTVDQIYTFKDWDRPYLPFGNFGGKVGVSILFGKMPKK